MPFTVHLKSNFKTVLKFILPCPQINRAHILSATLINIIIFVCLYTIILMEMSLCHKL